MKKKTVRIRTKSYNEAQDLLRALVVTCRKVWYTAVIRPDCIVSTQDVDVYFEIHESELTT